MTTEQRFIDHNGRIAFRLWSGPDSAKPVIHTSLWVSRLPTTGNEHILRLWIQAINGRVIATYDPDPLVWNRYGRVTATDWAIEVVQESVPKPKDGPTYTWDWSNGAWHKVEYPYCHECLGGALHEPSLPHCEDCGYAHKPEQRHRRRARTTWGLIVDRT